MDTPGGPDVRCSTVVFRDDAPLRASRERVKVLAAALTGAGAEP